MNTVASTVASAIASIATSSAYPTSTSDLLAGTDTSSGSILDQMSEAVEGASSNSTTSDSTDIVDLSDQAKALLDHAKANKLATDKIDAFLQNGSLSEGTGNSTPATSSQQDGTTSSSAATSAPQSSFRPFTPTQSISKTVNVDGYTFTLNTDAGTQWYGIELNGNGIQAYSKHFGPSDGAVGFSGVTPGVDISAGPPDADNEAFDAITVTRNAATASTASVASSSAGSASASAVDAQSSSITFLVNYKTGEISIAQSAASVSAQSVQGGAPGSTLSTLA